MAKIFLFIIWSLSLVIWLVGYIGQKVMEKRARKFSEERRK